MKSRFATLYLLFSLTPSFAFAGAGDVIAENKARQVSFAEDVIISEFARVLAQHVTKPALQCSQGSAETAIEVGVGLLGIARSPESLNALVRLIALKSDGSFSEQWMCQTLLWGPEIENKLSNLNPVSTVEWCQSRLADLKRKDPSLTGLPADLFCQTEKELEVRKQNLLNAIRSGRQCVDGAGID